MAGKGQPAGNIKLGISLDDTNFGNTLDEINAKVKQAESNMRANLKAYDSAGRSYEALSQKTKDLSTVMEGQNAKVRELTKRRDEAISKYGEESKQVANLNTQINNATAKYNAYSRQLNDTKKELVYSKTAVNDLSNEIKENERQMNAEVKALKAAGDESGAFEAKQKGLAKQTELSEKAIEEQRKVVKLMADEFGDSANETEDAKRALEKLERQSQISSRQLETLERSSDQSGKKIEDFGDKSTRSARKLDGLKDKLGSLKGAFSFGAVAGLASQAVSGVVNSFMGLTDEAVEASDSMDKFVQTMQFAGIDNSKIEESKTVMKDYADQTVYELGDVMNTTAQLAANGVKDFDGLTQAIGNVNAVSGGNADTFKSVAMAMTQTVGAGKLTTENFNQIADAIPGASGKIQQALKQMGAYTDGDFREAMANGEISAEELNEAFMQLGMTDVAKKAAGSTATIEGAVGNLQASAVNMINEIINAFGKGNITSLISDIGKGIDDLTTKIKPAMESIKNVAQPVFDMLKKGADIATLAFGTLFGTLDGDQAKQGFDILTKIFPPEMVTFAQDTIEKIKNAVKTLFDVFKGNADMEDVLAKLGFSPETISKIKNVFDNLKTYFDGTMATIKNGIAIGWQIVKGVFDTLSPYIMPIIEKIGGAFSKIGKSMTTFWNENGKQIIEAIKNFFTFIQPVVKIVMDLVMGFIDNIIGLVEGIMNVIQGAIKIFTGLFTGDFSKMWEGVKQLFWGSIQAVWNWIQILFFKRILEGVKGLWTGFSGSIKGLWESTKTFFTEGISKTWDKLVNWVMNLLGKAGNLKTTFGNFIQNMWNSVKNFFSNGVGDTWNKVVGWVKNIFNKAIELKNNVSDAIGNLWNGIKDNFRSGIDTVFNWIKDLPSRLGKAISDGAHFVKDAFKGMFNAALKAVGGPVNAIIGGANWVLEKLGADKIQEWDVPQYAKGTDGHPGGPMMVNDGRGAEAVISPNGNVMIPKGRNVTMWGAPGTHVIPAEETAMMLGQKRPKYRYKKGTGFFGALGNMASKSWDWVKDKASGLGDLVGDVWDFVSNPLDLVKKVLGNVVDLSSLVKYPLDVAKGIVKKATDALVSKVTELFSAGDLDTGISGMQGVYKYLANVAQQVMKKFPGFVATSGYRPGDPYSHGKRNAIDIALPGVTGGSPKYTEAANYAFDKFKNQIGYVITNGKVRDRSGQSGQPATSAWEPWPAGDHYDHVHLNGVRDPQGGLVSGGDSVGGSGVERWRPYVKRALKMNNLPTSSAYVDAWMRQIQTESGGNPLAIGGNDGLADGNATGLLQTKPGTFAANAFPGYGNIMSGFDNILAAINYAKKRYGSDILGVIGRGHGYANGGIVNQHQIAEIAEGNKPEIIIPLDKAKRSRAMQLLAIAQDKLGVKPKSVNNSSDSGGTLETLVSLMIQQNNLLSKLLAKDISVKLDGKPIADNTNGYLGNQFKRSLYTRG
ncbi:tape measure protein [Enterococcus faecium]|uniref:tape measure protein n=2 Tax=Enterococcus faecium TaxID=1352 RepID=UPI001105A474|nr:tape measure protein [Enterococcus faecium]MDB7483850.1 tape measure protein [Enterococcus faecium]MDB7489067.1 tape measure protein [Enterococcus faecium]MDB7491491.1 tape measure protein [Enterococcus faecium]MDB7494035.1 tape measure protein [Enterococcus faecium]MDB7496863.1 tape measure protein [Enterococcus faecium]